MCPEITEVPAQQPLKGEALDIALKSAIEETPLDPVTVNRFLAVDTEGVGLSKVDKWVPGALMAAHIGTLAALNYYGESLPPVMQMPDQVHALLQAVHNLTVNAANSPTLRDHLPYLYLEGAGVWGAVKTLPNFLNIRSKRAKISEAQTGIKSRVEEGEQTFKMSEGHSAAFVGAGDRTGDLLQAIRPEGDVMLYGNAKLDSKVWQRIVSAGMQDELFSSLDRGDFANAGEVILFPVNDEDMFLPGPEGHDMTIDEMRAITSMVDAYSKKRGIAQKRVVIVGRRLMSETYRTRSAEGVVEERQETLDNLVKELQGQREAGIEIFDPTEVVMKAITDRADGRKIQFSATGQGEARYGERFFEALNEIGYQPTGETSMRVLYDIQDTPTEMRAGDEDIAVVLDVTRKQSLVNRGISESNIIVVPQVILGELSREVAS